MTDASERRDLAMRAARTGGDVALDTFGHDLAVETKAHKGDLLTQADRDAQRATIEAINEAFPDEPVVAEEDAAPTAVPDEGPAWVVDPIDGTANYVRGIPIWTTSVAAVVDGEAVAAATVLPALGERYAADDADARRNGDPIAVNVRDDPAACTVAPLGSWGTQSRETYLDLMRAIVERFGDFRRLGSMQATLAYVADGALDAALTAGTPSPWDCVAGAHLIDRAGGTVTDAGGDPWRHDSRGLVVSNGRTHDTALEAARSVA